MTCAGEPYGRLVFFSALAFFALRVLNNAAQVRADGRYGVNLGLPPRTVFTDKSLGVLEKGHAFWNEIERPNLDFLGRFIQNVRNQRANYRKNAASSYQSTDPD